MPGEHLVRLYEDSKTAGTCKGCQAPLDWYETVKGRNMPMNRDAVPRKSETDRETGRVVAFFSSDDTHWASCPAYKVFKTHP